MTNPEFEAQPDAMIGDNGDWTTVASEVLRHEAAVILEAADRLDDSINAAVRLLLPLSNKIVVTGVGKSGHIGRKIAATLCSTGSPAVYLHPAEAVHGDLGIYSPGDPTILLSKSGTTSELVRLVPILRQFDSPLIGILGNPASELAQAVDVFIDARVQEEADPNNLAPTSSTTLALALGDALALSLMAAKRFTPDDFARFHPAGQLGRNLLLNVFDVMHTGDQVAWIRETDTIKQVVITMTQRPLGAACVIDEQYRLVGLVTDGDLRRALTQHDDIRDLCVADIMTRQPIVTYANTRLADALTLMENRNSQISVLPVLDKDATAGGVCVGLLRLHDIYSSR